jgi:NADH:ubiquinone oxidoreductase subunit 3 (subunit A)
MSAVAATSAPTGSSTIAAILVGGIAVGGGLVALLAAAQRRWMRLSGRTPQEGRDALAADPTRRAALRSADRVGAWVLTLFFGLFDVGVIYVVGWGVVSRRLTVGSGVLLAMAVLGTSVVVGRWRRHRRVYGAPGTGEDG